MVLISYHWIQEQDGTIPSPLQSKSDGADRELSTAFDRYHIEQDNVRAGQQ
jgi:hypothetical protein